MKKYTHFLNEEKKSQSEMTMEEFLKDDKKCWVEGETKDGKQIWSCPDNFRDITTYKVLDEEGKFKIQFNEVPDFSGTGKDLKSLEGGPIKSKNYILNIAGITNLKGFAKQTKNIDISMCEELTSFEGLPISIDGNLTLNFCNKITSLKGLPYRVGGNISIEYLHITNLEHFPKEVGGSITLKSNKLTSLEGIVKKINGKFICEKELGLTSLEGGPEYVGKFLSFFETDNLKSYNGFPKNNMNEDWYGSDGPPEIETKFILDSRYINNTGPDYGNIDKDIIAQGLDPNAVQDEYWSKYYKKDNEPSYINYWEELFEYIMRVDKSKLSDVHWPKEFIDKQEGEIKSLMASSSSLRKFNIKQ